MATRVLPKKGLSVGPPRSLLVDDVLSNGKIEGLLADAGLPPDILRVQGRSLAIARVKWAKEDTIITTVEWFDVSINKKIICLHLSATRFLVGTEPYLWFAEGQWKLTITDHVNKPHTYDDIEFVLLD